MQNYVIIHVPHASAALPDEAEYLMDPKPEIALVTDWHTDTLFAGFQQVKFPWSRVFCDVERLIPDDLDAVGLGYAYEKTLAGDLLRVVTPGMRQYLRGIYDHHHRLLEQAIEQAVSLMPVLIIDAHSYSAEQVRLSGLDETDLPDICLGYDPARVPDHFMLGMARYFDQCGWSVALNRPYAGSIMPKRYAEHPDVRSLMFEVNKDLYLEPGTTNPDPARFERVKKVIETAIGVASTYDFGAAVSAP